MGTTTVLIGERFSRFLQIESTFLVRRGFEILTVADGSTAIDFARARHPRLILLDLEMATIDGAMACAMMRSEPALAFTPILIMADSARPEDRERCMKAGCTKFVVKPERPAELLGSIAQILSVRQRKVARMTVVFSVTETLAGRQAVGMAGNLSGTGLLLLAQRLVTVGTSLQLEFVVPKTAHAIKVTAQVIRARQNSEGTYEVGVHFTDLGPQDRQQIVDYVSA